MTTKNSLSLNFESLKTLQNSEEFIARHIGPRQHETEQMLADIGAKTIDDLTTQIVPKKIQYADPINLKAAMSEQESLSYLKKMASDNEIYKSYIGMGYYPTHVPPVIQRNVLENPGWYTAYTPYQPEIAQGRLEAILNFQQMTLDLTGMELASASLLDESTAAAEAMAMAHRVSKSKSNQFFIQQNCFPQTIDVVRTRAKQLGIEIIVGDINEVEKLDIFGALFQYPDSQGMIVDLEEVIATVHAQKGIAAVATDLMSLVMLRAPGELGADIVLGNSQRFGVPMAYGGPHAAFFATRDQFKRSIPGRIIGVSKDTEGTPALRMAMQTREQHIRREKATSNICTAQVLLANMAGFYAVYHGADGLKTIANRIHRYTRILVEGLSLSNVQPKGIQLVNKNYFDTITLKVGEERDEIIRRALEAEINLRIDPTNTLGISLDETTTVADIELLWKVLLGEDAAEINVAAIDAEICKNQSSVIPDNLLRTSPILTHPVFNLYHSETEMMRYLKRLENRDLALNHSMIALGSCTMKLNAASEMMPISWPGFAQIHPFVPRIQVQGYKQLIDELEAMLIAITGYDAIAMQPNSGAQGEYAGLLAIRNYLDDHGGEDRNVCLIPSSAHGTNPASAALAGMKVVVVKCDEQGNVDLDDLRDKVESVAEQLACIMVTYPSTHGVYEENIVEICEIVHQHGGQVYMDGANMNAQVGITSPGFIGSDVSHLNLHKTFSIPHGGGGPGMGPIGVKQHLAPYFPNHSVVQLRGRKSAGGAVSAAPFGSAGVLPISWAYIAMMGGKGQKLATQYALLNANYVATKLNEHYPVLYRGRNDRVAHECIIDLRPIKAATGITEVDIAKRLMDYGFHAPTMSFPVAGTFMIEPTESESKAELDRFIDAMISIKGEIEKVKSGEIDANDNPLKNAPHTQQAIVDNQWEHPYTREEAAFPTAWVKHNKFWPSVSRIDDVFGDRNLICSCPPIEAYQD
jgi:glycine dehydrogenase